MILHFLRMKLSPVQILEKEEKNPSLVYIAGELVLQAAKTKI